MKYAVLLSIFLEVLISSILPDENFSSFPIFFFSLKEKSVSKAIEGKEGVMK